MARLESNSPVYVGLKGGQILAGSLDLTGDGAQVRTAGAGTVATERGDIEYVRSRDQRQAWEQRIDRYRNPRLTDLWTGFVDLGASLSRGNARTCTPTTPLPAFPS